MISLKWMKFVTIIGWLKTTFCPNCIWGNQDLLKALLDHLLNIEETCDLNYIYKNELNKACFAYDTTYVNSKDLAKKIVSDKILKDKAYGIPLNSKYDGYQRALANMVYTFFDKKTGSRTRSNLNEVLAPDLHKPVIKNFKKRKVYLRFKDNIWAVI